MGVFRDWAHLVHLDLEVHDELTMVLHLLEQLFEDSDLVLGQERRLLLCLVRALFLETLNFFHSCQHSVVVRRRLVDI